MAFRGLSNGATAPGIQGRRATKELNHKNLNAVIRRLIYCKATNTCCMDLIFWNLCWCQHFYVVYSNARAYAWAWYFTKKIYYLRKEDYCFPIHLLVNFSTLCKYHGMKLHANFKEYCKICHKVTVRFWWETELSSASRNHLTTFFRPFARYARLRLCSAIVHFNQNTCLYFVWYGW